MASTSNIQNEELKKPTDILTVDDSLIIELEKRPLKKYKNLYYFTCANRFTVQPNGGTVYQCRNKFGNTKFVFNQDANEPIQEKMNLINKKLFEKIAQINQSIIKDVKLTDELATQSSDPERIKTISFGHPKSLPVAVIDPSGNYALIEQSKLNHAIPRGSSLKLVAYPAASYNVDTCELIIYYHASAVKITGTAHSPIMSDDARALMNL